MSNTEKISRPVIPDRLKPDGSPCEHPTAEAALEALLAGNKRYHDGTSTARDYHADRDQRKNDQFPFAAILGCADSRVAPELLFDQPPGQLFIVRIAGNFVNEDAMASLEYAVEFLGVRLIMVLGHSGCGAVEAALKVINESVSLPGSLPCLVDNIVQALDGDSAIGTHLVDAIQRNVCRNVEQLKQASPVLSAYLEARELLVCGGIYDIGTGAVMMVDNA